VSHAAVIQLLSCVFCSRETFDVISAYIVIMCIVECMVNSCVVHHAVWC